MLKAYASYFVSYALRELKDISNIKQIILFGSTAKNEAEKDSDIDIFIELLKDSEELKKKIEQVEKDFYLSREAMIFKTKNIKNRVHITIGKLGDWPKIRESIEANGIVLFGKHMSQGIRGKKHVLISWNSIEKNRGAILNKLYGVKINKKYYPGLIEKYGGEKIGKSSMLIPIENRDAILDFLKAHKVSAKILEVWRE